MGDGDAAGQFLLRALLIDMDPLLVTGRFRKQVDPLLRNLDPVADADLGADGGLDLVEVAEYPHARDLVRVFISGTLSGNDEFGFGDRHDLADADARRGLQQRRLAVGKGDDRHVGHDQIDRPCRRQRQGAFGDDLGFALRGVLHGDDDPLGAADEIHGAAHSRHHLAGDRPVGEMASRVDLQAAEHGDVDMAAADQAERHRAVEGAGARQRADRPAAGIGQQRMRHALLRNRPGADQSVLGLKEHVEAGGNVVGDQRRNADPQIDEIAAVEAPARRGGR